MRIDNEWSAYADVIGLAASRSHFRRTHVRKFESSICAGADSRTSRTDSGNRLVLQCNKFMQRLRKDYKFAELMLRMCDHAYARLLPTWSGLQRPEDFLMAPIVTHNKPYENERLSRLNTCFAELPHLNNRRWCDVFTLRDLDMVAQMMLYHAGDIIVSLLHMVGVSTVCLEVVTTLYILQWWRNMPDNSFKSACIELYNNYPVDFHIYTLPAVSNLSSRSVKIMTIDDRCAVAQVKLFVSVTV